MSDYTNQRWTVRGRLVNHSDFPGDGWGFADEARAKEIAELGYSVASHAARAWLAAQPKPVPEVGMRIAATLRSEAVVSGRVTSATTIGNTVRVIVGGVAIWAVSAKSMGEHEADILDWHEVTA